MVVEGVPYCSDVVSDGAQTHQYAEGSQVPPRLERAFSEGWRLRRVAAAPPFRNTDVWEAAHEHSWRMTVA